MIKSLDRKHRKEVFDLRKPNNETHLPVSKLREAILACGKQISEEQLMKASEIHSRGVSFDAFENMVLMPSCLDDWAATLSLPQILAICISRNGKNDDLEEVTDLDELSIEIAANHFAIQLKRVLISSAKQLQEAKVRMKEQSSVVEQGNDVKFLGLFVGGNMDDFHTPLTDHLGWPNPNFEKGMEDEHSEDLSFEVSAGLRISPKEEYDYVVRPEMKSPPTKGSRNIPRIEVLLKSGIAMDAKLRRAEVISLVLYTGPMFFAYNQALRHKKPIEKSYSTTLFVLASAIAKLTKVQNIPSGMPLYRGLGGDVELPHYFHHPDSRGRRGLTEFGFLSTSQSRDIAIHYSGAGSGKPIPTIFVIEVGSVNRGADISAFSQYSHEQEYLWPPGTFLEPIGQPRLEIELESVVTVFRVRAESNLKVMTTDEFLSAKRDMHLDSFDQLIYDVEQSLEEMILNLDTRLRGDISLYYDKEGEPSDGPICEVSGFIRKVVEQCKHVRKLQSNAPLTDFALNTHLLKHALGMLETAKMARSKLLGYLEDESRRICFDFDSSLKTCHRERMSFRWRSLPAQGTERIHKARELCADLGLLTIEGLEGDGLQQDLTEITRKLHRELGLLEGGENELDEPSLVSAAADGRPKRDLLLLIAAGANLNGRDTEGATPIFAAARYGHEDCLKLLLDQRADMNSSNNKGQTPVWIAVQTGQMECLTMLIEAKADVVTPDKDGMTPAWVAAQRGRDVMLGVLATAGANLDTADNLGDTPALVASHAGYTRCIQVLISQLANIGQANADGVTPLMMAAQQGDTACVELLLAAGAEANARGKNGWSALHGAAGAGSADCVRALLSAGADMHAVYRHEDEEAGVGWEETPKDTAVREGRAVPGTAASERHEACAAILRRVAEGKVDGDAGPGAERDADAAAVTPR